MKLSVIIVNYNVKYFLEQCLISVRNASKGIELETYVVDNASVDGSNKMVREKFPEVKLIANKENVGFSRANNQAIRDSKGEYVLLLNPDTVVEEDTFTKVIEFMDQHPEGGGLGVKMVDGKGKFLPESKRGLPTPAVAGYKISGLSSIFPKSKRFGHYHLGYLPKDQIHSIEILAGAFMLLRKSVLDEIGLLDETFFMYGEDIDLSYRIIKAGYKNFYFPNTRIIHYKGESTKKSSVNYVFIFYNAMVIFARKHFSQKNAHLFSVLINIAIYLRASISLIKRFLKRIFLPLADAALLFGGIYLLKEYWASHVIFPSNGDYPTEFMNFFVPAYIIIWITSVFLSGGYDKPIRPFKAIQGLIIGTGIILIGYALLSEQYRFSRALILLGTSWGALALSALRLALHYLGLEAYRIGQEKNKRFVIIGEKEEAERVSELLAKTAIRPGFVGQVSIQESPSNQNGFIGHLDQIKDLISIYKIQEIIFCAKDLSSRQIIDKMAELQDLQVDYKIAPPESLSIIGSNSINTSGDIYVFDINSLTKSRNRRSKRSLDLITSLLLLCCYPLCWLFVKQPIGLLGNILKTIAGLKTWVGYSTGKEINSQRLPKIRKGILNPTDAFGKRKLTPAAIERLNQNYSRDYKITNDINIILKGFRYLGR